MLFKEQAAIITIINVVTYRKVQPTADMLLTKTPKFCSGHVLRIVTGLNTIVSVAAVRRAEKICRKM